jgi:hypothetical protein
MRKHVSHEMRKTSLMAYTQVPELGEMQQRVYDKIKECNQLGIYPTDREIAFFLGYGDPNKIRPRRYELMEVGLIREEGKRKCTVTDRLAITWVTTR